MNESLTVLGAVIPVFGIILVGLAIRKINWLTEEADQSLLRVNINLLFPCLILDAALGNPALSRWSNLLLAPLVGFATVTAGMLLALGMCRLNGLREAKAARTFGVTVGIYNYSYVPIPLALMLFGEETVGVLFVHNVGVEVAMWTLGVMLLTGSGIGRDWRKIINAPLVSIILALGLNGLGLHAYLPKPVLTGIHWLGQCAIPMALILIGAVMADHLREFHASWGWRVIGTSVLLRLVVLPILFLLLARYLPASVELKRVIVLQAAMPAAVFPIVMSRHYGGDPPTALRVVIGTSVVGLVSIPFWIRVGMKFAGLEG
ncbi:MAG TPA: AEC family transporter [Candidatus Sulfotelmatobacter sp.]|nr:AEC family transporter [Candidatus Sulfotelmatobacter sp.]